MNIFQISQGPPPVTFHHFAWKVEGVGSLLNAKLRGGGVLESYGGGGVFVPRRMR